MKDFHSNNLIPTHNNLRSIESFDYWCGQFRKGIYKRECPAVVAIVGQTLTDSGSFYILDGHHYFVAASVCRFDFKKLDFSVKYFDARDFDTVNLDCGYCTPFNIKTQVRTHTIPDFKRRMLPVLELAKENGLDYVQIARSMSHLYCRDRTVKNLAELVKNSGF